MTFAESSAIKKFGPHPFSQHSDTSNMDDIDSENTFFEKSTSRSGTPPKFQNGIKEDFNYRDSDGQDEKQRISKINKTASKHEKNRTISE